MASVTNSSDKIEYSRMLVKRTAQTGEVPTIPPITANTLNLMIPTDLFVGEFFLNEVDDLLWIRTENGILPISLSGSTGSTGTQTLTQVLFEGNATNGYDIEVSNGDTIVYSGLSTGTTTQILGIDDNGRTIITSVSGGTGSGTSGTSGISGTSGTSGTSGISGTSGTSGRDGISSGQAYYFNESIDSDVSGYKELSSTPTTTGEVTLTTNLIGSQTGVLVQDFITPELGFSVIPAGIQRFSLHFLLPASNADVEGYVEIQLADSSGTTIGSKITSNIQSLSYIDPTNPGQIELDIVLPTLSVSPTNRMIVKIYLNNLDSTSRSVVFYTEGNANYSYVITSVGQVAGTSGTSGVSGTSGISPTGDTLWTSGTTLGSLTNVAGTGNTNTSPYTLVVGNSNVVGSGATGYNFVSGTNNSMTGGTASFLQGNNNKIYSGYRNAILGGSNHQIQSGAFSAGIFGGEDNIIKYNSYASVALGGEYNTIDNNSHTSIVGGRYNTIENGSFFSSVIGGELNKITNGVYSSIVGGEYNLLSGDYSSIIGGTGNTNASDFTLLVGNDNLVSGETGYNFVSGTNNTITNIATYASIVGGQYNTIKDNSRYSSIVGGVNNQIIVGTYASLIGGLNNMLTGAATASAIIGGQNITGTTSNMVYVPELTIVNSTEGVVLYNLNLDSSGKVIRTTPRITINNTADATFSLDGGAYKYATWIVGNSTTARTLRILNLAIGEEVAVFIQNTNVGNKTFNINYELSTFRISNGIGALITSITLPQNQAVTLVVRNINGTIIGSI